MPYALGQLHNCHHIPPSLPPISPSLPSVPPILTHNPPPTSWVGVGGGGKQQCIDFLGSSWNFPDFWKFDPPPNSPVGWIKNCCHWFLDSSWHFPDFLFPMGPPGGTLIFLGSESEMIVKVVICFTVEPLYLKHASNHKLRLPKLAMLSIRIRHYIVLL